MTPRARGWTVVALIAAVAILIASVSWALQWSNLGHSDDGWHGTDRSTISRPNPPARDAGTGVDVTALDIAGHRMMEHPHGWMGGMMHRHDIGSAAGLGEGGDPGTTGWAPADHAPGLYEVACHTGESW